MKTRQILRILSLSIFAGFICYADEPGKELLRNVQEQQRNLLVSYSRLKSKAEIKTQALVYLSTVASRLEDRLSEFGVIDIPSVYGLNWSPCPKKIDIDCRNTPALSEFETHTIWINWLQGASEEHEIYLFHEWMHLIYYDRNPFAHDNVLARLDSEVFAWKKTMELVEIYEKRKLMPIPFVFTQIRSDIQTFGLRPWVEMVFESNFIP